MNLDQLLGTMSTDQLQDLMVVWAPDQPMSNSKLGLFRALREQMSRPDRAEHCLELAGHLGRGVVRKLLRSHNVSQSVAVLAASSAARARPVEDTRAIVADLAAMGLVCIEPEKRWETYGSARVTVPAELVEPLRRATGIDERSWQEILNLADHLAALPGPELVGRAAELGLTCDEQAPVDDLAAQLAARPDRLAGLPAPLGDVVRTAVAAHAGIVPVERLGELASGLPGIDDALLADWRRALEGNFVGTIGDLSLLEYGIDLDGRALVVFTEVVEASLAEPADVKAQPADPVGPDFLLDLLELVWCARESVARLKASGALTAPSSDRIVARLNRPRLPLTDVYDLLELRVACAEKLGLVERAGDALAARRSAWEWERRAYEEQSADLFALIGFAVPTPRSKHHHHGLCEVAADLVRSLEPGRWRRGASLEHIALRRYLSRLEDTDLRGQIREAVHEVDKYVLPPFPGLAQLRSDVHEAVVMEAYAMGVLDLAIDGDRITAERLSEFGAVAAGRAAPQRPAAKLIATADFEVILLPEGDTARLRYAVGQFAVREKFEQTCHLRITRERVEEAVVRGLSADEMISVLREHADAGAVPQNVERSIRDWAGRVRVATEDHVHVFELPDEALLDVVAELPEMKRLIVRRIAPTALALRERPADRRLLAALRRLGVHVR